MSVWGNNTVVSGLCGGSLRLGTRDCGGVHSQSCGEGPCACPGLRGPDHPTPNPASHLRPAPARREGGVRGGSGPTGESSRKCNTSLSLSISLSIPPSLSLEATTDAVGIIWVGASQRGYAERGWRRLLRSGLTFSIWKRRPSKAVRPRSLNATTHHAVAAQRSQKRQPPGLRGF